MSCSANRVPLRREEAEERVGTPATLFERRARRGGERDTRGGADAIASAARAPHYAKLARAPLSGRAYSPPSPPRFDFNFYSTWLRKNYARAQARARALGIGASITGGGGACLLNLPVAAAPLRKARTAPSRFSFVKHPRRKQREEDGKKER